MKVLTVKTIEHISPEIQRDIHYFLRMEFLSDHIFRDKQGDRYSATLSMETTGDAIHSIIEQSVNIPEYTLVIDDLDLDNNKFERMIVKKGEIQKRKSGSMRWEE